MIVFGCRLYLYLYTHVNYLHIYIYFFFFIIGTLLYSLFYSLFLFTFFFFFDTAIQGTKLKQYVIPGYGHNAMKLKERKNQYYQYKSWEQQGMGTSYHQIFIYTVNLTYNITIFMEYSYFFFFFYFFLHFFLHFFLLFSTFFLITKHAFIK